MREINWRYSNFNQLTIDDLYAILALRQAIFIVEQKCIYRDIDNHDQQCFHIMGWKDNKLAAYARIVPPNVSFSEPSFGRIAICSGERKQGIGKKLMEHTIKEFTKQYPKMDIRISAQHYLEAFYQSFGFKTVSDPYLEDGIPHIHMLKIVKSV